MRYLTFCSQNGGFKPLTVTSRAFPDKVQYHEYKNDDSGRVIIRFYLFAFPFRVVSSMIIHNKFASIDSIVRVQSVIINLRDTNSCNNSLYFHVCY